MSGIYQKIWETRRNHPQIYGRQFLAVSGGSYESRAGGQKFERIHVICLMILSSKIYHNQSPIKSFDDFFQWIIQTFDWWLVMIGFGLLIRLWLPFFKKKWWKLGRWPPPGPMAGVRFQGPCFARPKWPTCSCNTTISLTRWEDLQQLCGKPMENAQDLKENHRKKTWLVIILPHCMAMYTTAPWTQTYHDTPRWFWATVSHSSCWWISNMFISFHLHVEDL